MAGNFFDQRSNSCVCSYLHWFYVYIEENADKLLNIDRTEVSSDYLKLVDNTAFELLGLFFCSAQVPKLCPATRCHGIFQIYEEN